MKKMMILMLTLFFLSVVSTNAQVTIGSDKVPHTGAVLDLQSTTQGLHLPNVALSANPTVFVLPGDTGKISATGMVVYNTANVGQGPGIYAWDGAKWFPIGSGSADSSNPCTSVTDIDGNTYPAKLFGTQCWMTKNLRVSRQYTGAEFVRGTANAATNDSVKVNPGYYSQANGAVSVQRISGVVNYLPGSVASNPVVQYSVSTTGDAKTDSVSYTPDYNALANQFGFLYTFTQAQTVCPEGWHLPSAAEWNTLAVTLGNVRDVSSPGSDELPTWSTNTAGKAMKANNYSYLRNGGTSTQWYNWGGFAPGDSNNSGFRALPAGTVNPDGLRVMYFSYNTRYWTSNVTANIGACLELLAEIDTLHPTLAARSQAFSVRCLRN